MRHTASEYARQEVCAGDTSNITEGAGDRLPRDGWSVEL